MKSPVKLLSIALLLLAAGFGLGRWGAGAPRLDGRGAPLGAGEMEAAVREALSTQGTLARVSRLARALEGLDESNVAGAQVAFDEKITALDKQDVQLFLSAWTALDPEAALNGALEWGLPSMRRFGAGVVVRDWAEAGGGQAAVARLRSETEWMTRDSAFGELVIGWVRSGDLDGVTSFVLGLPESDGRDILVASVLQGILLEYGVDEIVRWADAVPADAPDKFKRVAYRRALRQVSNRDPLRAAAWYGQHEGQDYAKNTMTVVVTEWVETDPEAAIAWVLERPPGPDRVYAMERLMSRWVTIDPKAAERWVQQADLESDLAPMLDPFIHGVAATHPEQASHWVDRIPDPKRREGAILVVATAWRDRDPAGAEAWLDSLDLSENLRGRIAQIRPGLPAGQRLFVPEETPK